MTSSVIQSSSPTSEIYSDEADSLSIREKSLLKRSVSKHHNNNFNAGYVPVHEQHLSKTGLRGRKTFAFWTIVALLFILAIGNLILTITILGVLRLGQGMQSIELIPNENAVKFFGDTDLGHVYKRDGIIEGFQDEPVEISAIESDLSIVLHPKNHHAGLQVLTMKRNSIVVNGTAKFEVRNKNNDVIFTNINTEFRELKNGKNFKSKLIETNRIASPVGRSLKIEGNTVHFKGSEGTNVAGKEVLLNSDEDVVVKTVNGSIVFDGLDGTYLDVRRLPRNNLRHLELGKSVTMSQYKICVCMPQGKLFRIRTLNGSRVQCNHINMSPQHNPCM